MKAKVGKFIILGLSFLLCLSPGGALLCHSCYSLKQDNKCSLQASFCRVGVREFCYTRRFLVGDTIVRIQRGCTFFCHTKEIYKAKLIKAEILCCKENLCNTHDIWTSHEDLIWNETDLERTAEVPNLIVSRDGSLDSESGFLMSNGLLVSKDWFRIRASNNPRNMLWLESYVCKKEDPEKMEALCLIMDNKGVRCVGGEAEILCTLLAKAQMWYDGNLNKEMEIKELLEGALKIAGKPAFLTRKKSGELKAADKAKEEP